MIYDTLNKIKKIFEAYNAKNKGGTDTEIKLTDDEILRKRVSFEAMKIYEELRWEKITEEYIKIYKNRYLTLEKNMKKQLKTKTYLYLEHMN